MYSSGVDIDGDPWADPPCMGADQYREGDSTGPLAVALQASYTKVAVGFAVMLTGRIEGHAAANVWDFGDGTVISNRLALSHSWSAPGTYTIRLPAYNDSLVEGVTAILVVEVTEAVYYVNQASLTPSFPYTNWQTAARSIQEAVSAIFSHYH